MLPWCRQVALASVMPRTVFVSIAAIVALAVVLNLARLWGALPAGSVQGGLGVWRSWQLAAGVFGMAVVPQVRHVFGMAGVGWGMLCRPRVHLCVWACGWVLQGLGLAPQYGSMQQHPHAALSDKRQQTRQHKGIAGFRANKII